MKTLTSTAAKNALCFIIRDNVIKERNLYEWIMLFATHVNIPEGLKPKLYIQDVNEGRFEVWTLGVTKYFPKLVKEFKTKDEAEDYIFQIVYQQDFRLSYISFFAFTYEIAERELVYRHVIRYQVNLEVAESIVHHLNVVKKIKETRIQEEKEQKERVKRMAVLYGDLYADLISLSKNLEYQSRRYILPVCV